MKFNCNKLTELRKEKKLSKTELMFELDKINFRVSRQTIINWENGKTFPTARQLGVLLEFYEADLGVFYERASI